MKNSSRIKGILLACFGSLLWGVSGTTAQYLFQNENFTPEWLVVIRMLFSGIMLLILGMIKGDKSVVDIWKDKQSVIKLLLFSIVGMLGVQYAYFASISHGNAATAAILQYLAPIIITIYLCICHRKLPKLKQIVCIALAMAGTFLIITKGNLNSLSVSKLAIFWGIASAFGGAAYTLQPVALLKKYSSTAVVGWGMIIGGGAFSLINSPFNCEGNFSIKAILAIGFVVIFGTLIAFCLYMESLKHIEPYESSLLGCVEPLSAALLSILFLNVSFNWVQWLGTVCILVTISALSIMKE